MSTIVRAMTRSIEVAVALLLLAMAAALLLEVVLRFLFSVSLPWTSEFARYAMIWITFLGAALAIHGREHIQVTFFLELLPDHLQRHALIVVNVILMAFVAALLRYSVVVMTAEMKMSTAAMNIPFGFVVLALPFSAALMLVYLLADTAALLRNHPVTFNQEGHK